MTKTCISGGHIVTLATGQPDTQTGDILIDASGRIEAIGQNLSATADTVIDAAGMIVMPGFVNAHIHTWQTGLKGITVSNSRPHRCCNRRSKSRRWTRGFSAWLAKT